PPQVVCGFYIAAENNWLETTLDPVFENYRGSKEFLVVLDVTKGLETCGELAKLTALVFGPVSTLDNLRRRIVALESEVDVSHRVLDILARDSLAVTAAFAKRVQTSLEHLNSCPGAGHHSTQER